MVKGELVAIEVPTILWVLGRDFLTKLFLRDDQHEMFGVKVMKDQDLRFLEHTFVCVIMELTSCFCGWMSMLFREIRNKLSYEGDLNKLLHADHCDRSM